MTKQDFEGFYRAYIVCLNQRNWQRLDQFVHEDVQYNDRSIGSSGYREMLERDVADIPDLVFEVQLLMADPPFIASRIVFNCSPKGQFLGLPVNGTTVRFAENVFYELREGKIRKVWSVIDKPAIEAQLSLAPQASHRGATPVS